MDIMWMPVGHGCRAKQRTRFSKKQDGSAVGIAGGIVMQMEVIPSLAGKKSMENGTILMKKAGW